LELSALCSIFISCMKAKGSKKAILLLLEMITSIENSSFKPEIVTGYDGDGLIILLPPDVKDWTLIRDVLDYILPSGTSYTIRNQTEFNTPYDTGLDLSSNVNKDYSWNYVSSSIIKQKQIESLGNDIVNYNVKMMAEENTGKATTGEVDSTINKDIYSVDSKILTRNKTSLDDERAEQERINAALNKATTEQTSSNNRGRKKAK